MKLSRKAGLILAATALACLGGFAALGQAPQNLLTSLLSTDVISVYRYTSASINGATPGVVSNYVRSTSLLYTTTGTAATTGTTIEQTLGTYSLPASTLATGTPKLLIRASWSTGANTNTKTVKCYFGPAVMTSASLATNNKNGSCELVVTNIAANQQVVYGNMLVDTTPITGYVNFPTSSTSGAITIKVTGSNGSPLAQDIVLNDFSVERVGQ